MTSREEVSEFAAEVVDRLLPGLLVRTEKSQFSSPTPNDDVLENVVLTAGINGSVGRGATTIAVRATYDVSAVREPTGAGEADETESPPEGWHSNVVVHGQWRADDGSSLSSDQVRAFAVKVGLMALHPYARAHIHNAVGAAGWPAYTLDVLTQQDDLFRAQEGEGEIDLALVDLD